MASPPCNLPASASGLTIDAVLGSGTATIASGGELYLDLGDLGSFAGVISQLSNGDIKLDVPADTPLLGGEWTSTPAWSADCTSVELTISVIQATLSGFPAVTLSVPPLPPVSPSPPVSPPQPPSSPAPPSAPDSDAQATTTGYYIIGGRRVPALFAGHQFSLASTSEEASCACN